MGEQGLISSYLWLGDGGVSCYWLVGGLDTRGCTGGAEPGFPVPVTTTGTTPVCAFFVEHSEALPAGEGLALNLFSYKFNQT